MSESEFVRHIPCDNCGSSDANSLYSDGHTFCFRCYTHTSGNAVVHNHTMRDVHLQGSAGRLQKRRISERTCELFKAYKDGEQLRFHYYNSSGSLLGAKIKTKDKEFRCEGEVKTLFGMQNFRHKTTKKEQKLVICEGEMDALSIWEHNLTGTWSPSLTEQQQQRKRSNTTTNGSTTTTRSSFSLTTMKPVRRLLKTLPGCYHLARCSSAF